MLNYTVSADLIDGIIDCAKRCGVPRAAALRRTQAGRREAAATRFSGQHLAWVWERIARQSDDPLIGSHMALIAELKSPVDWIVGWNDRTAPELGLGWSSILERHRKASPLRRRHVGPRVVDWCRTS
jgi:hypothetical protein